MNKDVFASVPEFLAAFDNIMKNGFFEDVEFSAKAHEGHVNFCSLKISGYIPDDSKHMKDGSGVIINPGDMVAACRRISGNRKVKNISTNVETCDWPIWDKTGNNIIGSKGKYTKLSILIMFKT